MVLLARIEDGASYSDVAEYVSGHVISCPECDVEYRVFYTQEPRSVTHQAAGVPALEDAVEQSHPEHPKRISMPSPS
jgi:hypothetical protein